MIDVIHTLLCFTPFLCLAVFLKWCLFHEYTRLNLALEKCKDPIHILTPSGKFRLEFTLCKCMQNAIHFLCSYSYYTLHGSKFIFIDSRIKMFHFFYLDTFVVTRVVYYDSKCNLHNFLVVECMYANHISLLKLVVVVVFVTSTCCRYKELLTLYILWRGFLKESGSIYYYESK